MTSRDGRALSVREEAFSKAVLDNMADAVSVNVGMTRVYVNEAYLQLYGLSDVSEAVGRQIDEHMAPEHRHIVRERALSRQRGAEETGLHLYRIIRPDGEERVIEARGIAVSYEGSPASLAILRDVTERARQEENLRHALSLNAATLESTADGILVVNAEGRIVNYNARFAQMWGVALSVLDESDADQAIANAMRQVENPDAFLAKVLHLISSPEEESFDVLELLDGRVFERYSLPQKIGDDVVGRVWSFRDITERVKLEAELRRQAERDPLTDLLNRRAFAQRLERAVVEARESGRGGSLLLLDLDDFKDVNDGLGHQAGDRVLVDLTALVVGEIGDDFVISRLGGDEFAVLMPGTDEAAAIEVGDRLLSALRLHAFEQPNGEKVVVTASMGHVSYPKDGSTVEELMSRVDLALYEAKAEGRNQAKSFKPMGKLEADAESRLKLRHTVRQAMRDGGFRLYAQPIQNLRTGEVSQHELLLRLKQKSGRVLAAQTFIGVAERSGMILPIDRWVVHEAIMLLRTPAMMDSSHSLALNVSAKAFSDPGLFERIAEDLRGRPDDAHRLVFEVTETAAISNIDDAEKFMRAVTRLGCRFALDDFGVGFSSLQRLRRLPIDYLKIDGSFVRMMMRSAEDRALVQAVVNLAEALHMETIAEFVERPEQLEMLRDLGVDHAQGHLIGRPRSLAALSVGDLDRARVA